MAENNTTVEATETTEVAEAPKEETTPAPKKGGKKHIIVDPITRIE